MKVIAQESWNWTLLEDADGYYFSVLCGGIAMYATEFKLTTKEADEFSRNIPVAAANLAQQVRGNPEGFNSRHLKDFSTRDEVWLAGLRWRKERRSEG